MSRRLRIDAALAELRDHTAALASLLVTAGLHVESCPASTADSIKQAQLSLIGIVAHTRDLEVELVGLRDEAE